MNQERLDELENRVGHLEEGNGWHEWGKYVLKKLESIEQNHKETRKELCEKMDDIVDENTVAHRELHRKMDVQKNFCAERPLACAKTFTFSKTFYWVIGGVLTFMVMIGGLSLANWKAITTAHANNNTTIEQPINPKK